MKKTPRKTTVGSQTSISHGQLYFEDVFQARIDTPKFIEIIDDKHLTAIRLESLDSDWHSHEWVTGVGYINFDVKIEMTLRKEIRSGTSYWYAYRKVGGKQFKRFVGQSDRVTTKRLVEIAQKLPGV